MIKLFSAIIIWAFSFSLIGQYLSGQVDIYLAIFIRFGLALLVFLPFLRWRMFFSPVSLGILLIGAVQIGLMYVAYFHSFLYLSVSEVALFTVTTPLYVVFLGDLLEGKWKLQYFGLAALSTTGAAIIRWHHISPEYVWGLTLVQVSNLCFAFGQVSYKKFIHSKFPSIPERSVFGMFFIGAIIPIIPLLILKTDWSKLPQTPIQIAVLLWLGIVASGLGYFLWNSGSKKVSVGQMAVMNNALIPMAILVNLLFWQGQIDWPRFGVGALLIVLAVWLGQRS